MEQCLALFLQSSWGKLDGWNSVARDVIERFGDETVESVVLSIAAEGLRSHKEHAPGWRSGWVKWTNPLPWKLEICVNLGYLVADTEHEGVTVVHITDEGREFLTSLEE